MNKLTIKVIEVEQKVVCIIDNTCVGGIIPDGLDNVHAADEDAPLSKGENTDDDRHPSFPFPESDPLEYQQCMIHG